MERDLCRSESREEQKHFYNHMGISSYYLDMISSYMGIIMGYHHVYLISTSTALMLRLRRLRLVPVALHVMPPGSLNKRLEPRIRESVNHHVNH